MKPTICLFLVFVMQPLSAISQSNPSAHEHGKGNLAIVYDNNRLVVSLTTPATNMLGFEHQPNSEQQWQMVEALSETLHQPDLLITLEPGCELKDVAIELPYKRDSDAALPKNAHEHHKESVDSHHHDDAHKNHHNHDHKDIHSLYEWQCAKAAFPKLTLHYFDRYLGFDTIIVEWVVNDTQGVTQLNKRENTLEIAQ